MMRRNEIEVVMPYGNPNGALHYRFVGDYTTFCGREAEGWSKAVTTEAEALESDYTCKRCKTAYLK